MDFIHAAIRTSANPHSVSGLWSGIETTMSKRFRQVPRPCERSVIVSGALRGHVVIRCEAGKCGNKERECEKNSAPHSHAAGYSLHIIYHLSVRLCADRMCIVRCGMFGA